jgi:hypothetical protein
MREARSCKGGLGLSSSSPLIFPLLDWPERSMGKSRGGARQAITRARRCMALPAWRSRSIFLRRASSLLTLGPSFNPLIYSIP